MKHATFCLFLCLLLLSIKAFSQKSVPGFIVGLNEDTIHGTFDFDEKWRSFDSISFKPENGSLKLVKPEDTRYVSIQNYRYVSTEIFKEDLNRGKPPEIMDSSKVCKFLQILFQGPKSLYSYYDGLNLVHLFISDSDTIKKLIYKEYPVRKYYDNGNYFDYMRKDQRFVGQLILDLQDCPELNTKISHVDYNARAVSKLYNKYYKCTAQTPVFSIPKEKFIYRPGLIAGINLTSIHFANVSNFTRVNEIANADYEQSSSLTAGAFVEIVLPRNKGNISVIPELCFSSFHLTGMYHFDFSPTVYYDYKTDIKNSYVGVNLLTRYAIPVNKLRIFLNAGLRWNIMVKGEATFLQTQYANGTINVLPEKDAPIGMKTSEEGLIVGLGLMFSRFSIEGRYSVGDGITRPSRADTNVRQIGILLGARLK